MVFWALVTAIAWRVNIREISTENVRFTQLSKNINWRSPKCTLTPSKKGFATTYLQFFV